MKTNLIFSLFLLSLLWSCQTELPTELVENIIADVEKEHIPDGRTTLYKIEAKANGNKIHLTGRTSSKEALEELTQQLFQRKLPIQNDVVLTPTDAVNSKNVGIVHLSVANIRSQPKHSAELATQALMGTTLRLHDREEDWYLVQTPDNYFGWIDKGGFVEYDGTQQTIWEKAQKFIVRSNYSIVRNIPDETGEAVSDVVFGNTLQEIPTRDNLDGWVAVRLPDDREGFLPLKDVADYEDWSASAPLSGEQLIQIARRFMGVPYLWGGTSAKGFDCSGFTKTVYAWNNILLERDASLQVHQGKPISTTPTQWENLQPGDLLFFGKKATDTTPQKVTHVALWMGNGKIIHATERVKIESLIPEDDDFAADRFATFLSSKRMLDSE